MPRATDIVGWVIDGTLYCLRCCPSQPTTADSFPIFAVDESANITTCDDCAEPLMED